MNSWASVGKYDCNFLCVCVVGGQDGLSLARKFSQSEKLTHCVNGFVEDESEMPTYGQLGCQGFIVLDANQKVVSRATSPFMQVRGLAFEHVEALLDALCQQKPLPPVCPGETMELVEAPPEQPRLKGSRGICVKLHGDQVDFGFETGPLRGRMMRVPVSKVRKLEEFEESEEEETNGRPQAGCSTGTCGVPTRGSSGGGAGACSNKGDCGGGGGAGAKAVDMDTGPSPPPVGPTPVDSAFVAEALNLVSVKVPSMDAEHAECASALRQLAEEGSRPALDQVLACLSEHFSHEEALFDEFGFGVHKNEKLSAKKTHVEDHKRILGKIRQQLESSAALWVPADFVVEVLRDFHEHTSRYDTQYGDHLSAKGAH
mmetsp:Transcript_72444/g.167823  ORF Transcript_72444/g.167823 Transcript_72444/m.167823 type:complete len:372 (+) Transcript_72444:123-1238(+)